MPFGPDLLKLVNLFRKVELFIVRGEVCLTTALCIGNSSGGARPRLHALLNGQGEAASHHNNIHLRCTPCVVAAISV